MFVPLFVSRWQTPVPGREQESSSRRTRSRTDSHHRRTVAVMPMVLMASTSPSSIVHAGAPIPLRVHDVLVHSTGLGGGRRGTRYRRVRKCCYRRGCLSKIWLCVPLTPTATTPRILPRLQHRRRLPVRLPTPPRAPTPRNHWHARVYASFPLLDFLLSLVPSPSMHLEELCL